MYCMECGKEIPEDGQFCPGCGVSAPAGWLRPRALSLPVPVSIPVSIAGDAREAPSPQDPSVPPAQGFGQAGPPPAPYTGQAYPGPGYPAHYGYPPFPAAPYPRPTRSTRPPAHTGAGADAGLLSFLSGQAPPIVVVLWATRSRASRPWASAFGKGRKYTCSRPGKTAWRPACPSPRPAWWCWGFWPCWQPAYEAFFI